MYRCGHSVRKCRFKSKAILAIPQWSSLDSTLSLLRAPIQSLVRVLRSPHKKKKKRKKERKKVKKRKKKQNSSGEKGKEANHENEEQNISNCIRKEPFT